MEKTTSRVNVAPTPWYRPRMPFSRYNCKASCREVSDSAEPAMNRQWRSFFRVRHSNLSIWPSAVESSGVPSVWWPLFGMCQLQHRPEFVDVSATSHLYIEHIQLRWIAQFASYYLFFKAWRKTSLATSLIAFSGVIRRIFTAEPIERTSIMREDEIENRTYHCTSHENLLREMSSPHSLSWKHQSKFQHLSFLLEIVLHVLVKWWLTHCFRLILHSRFHQIQWKHTYHTNNPSDTTVDYTW